MMQDNSAVKQRYLGDPLESRVGVTVQKNSSGSHDKAQMLELFRKMFLIRRFEETSAEYYTKGYIRGFLHLYSGQEATGVGAVSALRPEDYLVTHYRDHGHALARGVDVNRAMAELFGRRTGLSKGKGGSMHLFDTSKNFMGGHAIVGGQLPLALGLALAQQYRESSGVTMVFLGDGSANQGTYHETLNMASVWKLPLIFFLENNGFGMGSAVGRVHAGQGDFSKAMSNYGIKSVVVDGMDVLSVKKITEEAVNEVRANGSPFFIEAKTYRFAGHSVADGQKYRTPAEVDLWRRNDPISTFPAFLVDNGIASVNEIESIQAGVEKEVTQAIEFSLASPNPELSELTDDVLA